MEKNKFGFSRIESWALLDWKNSSGVLILIENFSNGQWVRCMEKLRGKGSLALENWLSISIFSQAHLDIVSVWVDDI